MVEEHRGWITHHPGSEAASGDEHDFDPGAPLSPGKAEARRFHSYFGGTKGLREPARTGMKFMHQGDVRSELNERRNRNKEYALDLKRQMEEKERRAADDRQRKLAASRARLNMVGLGAEAGEGPDSGAGQERVAPDNRAAAYAAGPAQPPVHVRAQGRFQPQGQPLQQAPGPSSSQSQPPAQHAMASRAAPIHQPADYQGFQPAHGMQAPAYRPAGEAMGPANAHPQAFHGAGYGAPGGGHGGPGPQGGVAQVGMVRVGPPPASNYQPHPSHQQPPQYYNAHGQMHHAEQQMPSRTAAPSGRGLPGEHAGFRGRQDPTERSVRFQEPPEEPQYPPSATKESELHSGLSYMYQGPEAQEQLKKKNETRRQYAQELQEQIKAKEEEKRRFAEEKKREDEKEEARIQRELAELRQEAAGEGAGGRAHQQPEARTSPTKPKERNPLLSPTADPGAPVQRFHSNNLGMTPDEIRKKVQAQAEIQAALKVQILEKERQKKMAVAREKFEEEMEEQRVQRQQKEMREAYLRDKAGLPPAPARGVTGEQGDKLFGVSNSAAAVKAAAGAFLGSKPHPVDIPGEAPPLMAVPGVAEPLQAPIGPDGSGQGAVQETINSFVTKIQERMSQNHGKNQQEMMSKENLAQAVLEKLQQEGFGSQEQLTKEQLSEAVLERLQKEGFGQQDHITKDQLSQAVLDGLQQMDFGNKSDINQEQLEMMYIKVKEEVAAGQADLHGLLMRQEEMMRNLEMHAQAVEAENNAQRAELGEVRDLLKGYAHGLDGYGPAMPRHAPEMGFIGTLEPAPSAEPELPHLRQPARRMRATTPDVMKSLQSESTFVFPSDGELSLRPMPSIVEDSVTLDPPPVETLHEAGPKDLAGLRGSIESLRQSSGELLRDAGLQPDNGPVGRPLLEEPDETRELDEVGRLHLANKNKLKMLEYIKEEQEGGASMESMDALLIDFLAQSERQAFEHGRRTDREQARGAAGSGAPKVAVKHLSTDTTWLGEGTELPVGNAAE